MADYNFTATSRVPNSPLSYANKDLAEPKEVLVDYDNHQIYVCDSDGTIVNVTASVTTVVEEVINQLDEDPTALSKAIAAISLELPSGETINMEQGIIQAITDIEELKESLGLVVDDDGNIILNIDASVVNTNDELQFVSSEQKTEWSSKSTVSQLTTTILSGEDNWEATDGAAPYTQTVNVTDIAETDYPIVDIVTDSVYDTAMDELKSYAYIYKILTYDGYIKIFAILPTEVDLNIIMKTNR